MNSQSGGNQRFRLSKKHVTLAIGPLLLISCLLLPTSDTMKEAARTSGAAFLEGPKFGLGVLLWTATWWITEATPLGLAALVPPMLFCLSGLVPWKDALASFTDPLIWVIMAGFLFAHAFHVWRLDERVTLSLMSLSRTRNPVVAGFFVASLPVFFLTIIGSITASTSIVYGFVLSFLAKQDLKKGSRYRSATLLALGQASTAGALIFLTSTPPNLIAKKTIETFTSIELTFIDWFIVGSVHALIGLILSWLLVYLIIKPEIKSLPLDQKLLRNELRELPPMGKGEKSVVTLLSMTLILWIVPSLLTIAASLNPALTTLSDAASRILPEAAPAVIAMLLFPLINADNRPLLGWNEILTEAINWDIIFLLGGGITLGIGLNRSGFSHWVGSMFRYSFGTITSELAIFAFSALLAFILTYPASNTGAASVACPLAATMASAAKVNPIPPVLGAAIASSISSSLPSTTPPMAIVYSSGYVKMRDMFKVGIICDLLRFGLLLVLGFPLAKYLLTLKSIS